MLSRMFCLAIQYCNRYSFRYLFNDEIKFLRFCIFSDINMFNVRWSCLFAMFNLYHSLGLFARLQIDIFLIFPRK